MGVFWRYFKELMVFILLLLRVCLPSSGAVSECLPGVHTANDSDEPSATIDLHEPPPAVGVQPLTAYSQQSAEEAGMCSGSCGEKMGVTLRGSRDIDEHGSREIVTDSPSLRQLQVSELADVLYDKCVLLCVPPCDPSTHVLLEQLGEIFQHDKEVFVGMLLVHSNTSEISWRETAIDDQQQLLAFYPREVRDRTCLLIPPRTFFQAERVGGQLIVETLVQFLNEKCGTFRTPTGGLTDAGQYHQHIMSNLYSPKKPVGYCDRIKVPTGSHFIQEYLFRSQPVVIENAISHWPAFSKWTFEYLHYLYGNKNIHIKLTPDGNFEGVESATLWKGYHENWIPPEVKSQLPYPDLVVVRPATAEMPFSDFLDFITSGNRSFSAYLEYSSIPDHMPELERDILEIPFVKGLLELRQLNIWLSDGNTLGKLHFDPFDNFLCQISGEKHLTLFPPHHNEDLYEAHIPEAILSFDASRQTFHRKTLLRSTSMVMSPVDIEDPDHEKFPRFARAHRMLCRLKPGDVLFMPSFWWHEVQSYPDPVARRNLAVNFWYEPVLSKEFPCAKCRLHFNMFYRNLLEPLI